MKFALQTHNFNVVQNSIRVQQRASERMSARALGKYSVIVIHIHTHIRVPSNISRRTVHYIFVYRGVTKSFDQKEEKKQNKIQSAAAVTQQHYAQWQAKKLATIKTLCTIDTIHRTHTHTHSIFIYIHIISIYFYLYDC